MGKMFNAFRDRLRIAHHRRSQVKQQLIDDRAEMELDLARRHIITVRAG